MRNEFCKIIDCMFFELCKFRLDAEGSSLSIADLSGLIEKLARAERLNEATRLTEQLMEQSLHPYPRVLKFLVTRLGSAGDVSSLERMEGKLSPVSQ